MDKIKRVVCAIIITLGLLCIGMIISLPLILIAGCEETTCNANEADPDELIYEGKLVDLDYVGNNRYLQLTFEDGFVSLPTCVGKQSREDIRIGQTGEYWKSGKKFSCEWKDYSHKCRIWVVKKEE